MSEIVGYRPRITPITPTVNCDYVVPEDLHPLLKVPALAACYIFALGAGINLMRSVSKGGKLSVEPIREPSISD